MKKVKSELQLAADRVRDMQVAVENTQHNLKVCEKEYNKHKLAFERATRNLADTRDFLSAQQNKLEREVSSVRDIVGAQYYNVEYPI